MQGGPMLPIVVMTLGGDRNARRSWRCHAIGIAPAAAVATLTWSTTRYRTVAIGGSFGIEAIGSQWRAALVTIRGNKGWNVRLCAEQTAPALNPDRQQEVKLWCAVIDQAINDATTRRTSTQAMRDKEAALSWLLVPNHDFDAVCTLALIDADAVRDKVRQMTTGGGSKVQAEAL